MKSRNYRLLQNTFLCFLGIGIGVDLYVVSLHNHSTQPLSFGIIPLTEEDMKHLTGTCDPPCTCGGTGCPGSNCSGCNLHCCFCNLPHCEDLTSPCYSPTSHTPSIACTHKQKECTGEGGTGTKHCSNEYPQYKPCNSQTASGCCGGCWSEKGGNCPNYYGHDRGQAYGCTNNSCGTPHCIKSHGPGDGCDCSPTGMCRCGTTEFKEPCEEGPKSEFWDTHYAGGQCARCSALTVTIHCPQSHCTGDVSCNPWNGI